MGTPLLTITDDRTWPAVRALILANWEMATRAVAAVVTSGAPTEDLDAVTELLRVSATPQMCLALQDAALGYDLSGLFGDIRASTLVLARRNYTPDETSSTAGTTSRPSRS